MERIFKDQMNRAVRLEGIPRRIVSLVPSQTELLFDLGLDDEVVGLTKFCIHPDSWFRSKDRVGGTKQVNIDKVRSLKPDLIIGNKEENTEADILELEKIAPVWMSDIYTVQDALDMIRELGIIVCRDERSASLVKQIQSEFDVFIENPLSGTFLYYIWKAPDFVSGRMTYISDLLESTGLKNLCMEERYPEWNCNSSVPDFVLLSTEPYPFKKEHLVEFELKFPNSRVILIDGEMCSWYGSRMLRSAKYLSVLFQ